MIEFLPFTVHSLPLFISLALLLFMSALISGAETAFFSLNPVQINELHTGESRKTQTVLRLLDNQDSLLSTILILNNLINIGAILVASAIIDITISFADSQFLEFIVKVVLVTFLLLLFGEIMPKIFATYNNIAFAKFMAIPLLGARVVVAPLSFVLIKLGGALTRSLSGNGHNVSIDELQDAIEITKTETPEDKEMLSGIVRFVGTQVVEIMKPRIDVVALEVEDNFVKVKQTVIKSGFSRIPVYKDSFDNIQGILFIKDILKYIERGEDFEWQKLARKPYFVPEHKKINDLLEDFQTLKIHLAVVVDEYGGTLGIVTLEDILEEVVGDIADDSDAVESFYQKVDENNYIFDGKTHIVDFERVLKLDDDFLEKVKGEADTLAGLMLEIKGDFVKVEEWVEFGKMRFTAQEIDNHRIIKILVTLQ